MVVSEVETGYWKFLMHKEGSKSSDGLKPVVKEHSTVISLYALKYLNTYK
jgi:hypothetical protein